MKSQLLLSATVCCLAVLACSPSAHAQSTTTQMAVTVPFAFHVGDQAFPAGSYKITRQAKSAPELMIRGEKLSQAVPVTTRLARLPGSSAEVKTNLVFDTVGTEHYLSEVWIPGMDGYLVRGTEESHEHAILELKESAE